MIQNNESRKHIDRNVLNNLDFKINHSSLHYKHLNTDKVDSSIIVKNGIDYDFINLNNKSVIINTLNSDFDLLINKLEKNQDLFKDDYIVNLNSIFLNSGFDFTLNENRHLLIIEPLCLIGRHRFFELSYPRMFCSNNWLSHYLLGSLCRSDCWNSHN